MGWFGPRQRKHKHIKRNLAVAHPHASDAELEETARQIWQNLGGVILEYPHLREIYNERTTITIAPQSKALLDAGTPVAVLSAHLGNWELLAHYFGAVSKSVTIVYGPQGKDMLDKMIQRFRSSSPTNWIPKSDALRQMSASALDGGTVGFLPDVRVESGHMLPLFGIDTPTTITPARIALRLHYPIIPARVIRHPDARFEIEVLAPLVAEDNAKGKLAALSITRQYNEILEGWIRERPGDWHCTKRRWPKEPQQAAA